MSGKARAWGPDVWRDMNAVDGNDLPVVGGRHLSVPGVRAAAHHRLPDEIGGAMQGRRIRDLLGHRRHRGRSSSDRRFEE